MAGFPPTTYDPASLLGGDFLDEYPDASGYPVSQQPDAPPQGSGVDAGQEQPANAKPAKAPKHWMDTPGIGGGTKGQNLLTALAFLLEPTGTTQFLLGYNKEQQRQKAQQMGWDSAAAKQADSDATVQLRRDALTQAANRDMAMEQYRTGQLASIKARLAADLDGKTNDQVTRLTSSIVGQYGADPEVMNWWYSAINHARHSDPNAVFSWEPANPAPSAIAAPGANPEPTNSAPPTATGGGSGLPGMPSDATIPAGPTPKGATVPATRFLLGDASTPSSAGPAPTASGAFPTITPMPGSPAAQRVVQGALTQAQTDKVRKETDALQQANQDKHQKALSDLKKADQDILESKGRLAHWNQQEALAEKKFESDASEQNRKLVETARHNRATEADALGRLQVQRQTLQNTVRHELVTEAKTPAGKGAMSSYTPTGEDRVLLNAGMRAGLQIPKEKVPGYLNLLRDGQGKYWDWNAVKPPAKGGGPDVGKGIKITDPGAWGAATRLFNPSPGGAAPLQTDASGGGRPPGPRNASKPKPPAAKPRSRALPLPGGPVASAAPKPVSAAEGGPGLDGGVLGQMMGAISGHQYTGDETHLRSTGEFRQASRSQRQTLLHALHTRG